MLRIVLALGSIVTALLLSGCGQEVVTENGEIVKTYGETTDERGNKLSVVVGTPVVVAHVNGESATIYKFEYKEGVDTVVCRSTALNYNNATLSCETKSETSEQE